MPNKKMCPQCNTEVLLDEKFCHHCGYSFDNEISPNESNDNNNSDGFLKKSKYKGLVVLLATVLIILAGYLGYSTYQKHKIQSYLTEANAYIMEIEETTTDLYFINEAWNITEAGSWLYYGAVKSYAKNMFSSDIADAKEAFKSIETHYTTLQEMDLSNSTLQDAKEKIEDLQQTYETAYSMIIVFENGNCSTQISELKTITSEFKTIINDVADKWNITIKNNQEL